jgi:phosphoribosyl 1,2-cyclic phosphate phosphodiesterase
MKITILGCGPSGGVPLITGEWGNCDPKNPKNLRSRSSVYINVDGLNLIIDTSVDLRSQFLSCNIKDIDAVLYTHAHADHCFGIDEIRQIAKKKRRPVLAYADEETLQEISRCFPYAFSTLHSNYPHYLDGHVVSGPFDINGLEIVPFRQKHGEDSWSTGFRIGSFAYSTDLISLPKASMEALSGLDVWVLDCLQLKSHPTHLGLQEALDLIKQISPKRTILTHMSCDIDYDEISKKLPNNIQLAYDGMNFEV